jgi:hypothetical protein
MTTVPSLDIMFFGSKNICMIRLFFVRNVVIFVSILLLASLLGFSSLRPLSSQSNKKSNFHSSTPRFTRPYKYPTGGKVSTRSFNNMTGNEAFSISQQHSVDLNNTGVAFLENGHYNQAVSALASALGLTKQEMANDLRGTDEQKTKHSSCSSNLYYSSKRKFEFSMTTTPAMFVSMKNNNSKEEPSFIFRFPIKPKLGLTLVEMSVITMFNLALALHLSGLENHNNRRLEKAQSIYEYAFQIQTQEHVDLSEIFPLAILNNLGQIHTVLQNHEIAEMCFQKLLSSMLYILDQHSMERPREENNTLISCCWTGLLSNVTDLMFPASSPAPAA